MAMRSLGYMPSEVELAIIMQRLDMDGETGAHSIPTPTPIPWDEPGLSRDLGFEGPGKIETWSQKTWIHVLAYISGMET